MSNNKTTITEVLIRILTALSFLSLGMLCYQWQDVDTFPELSASLQLVGKLQRAAYENRIWQVSDLCAMSYSKWGDSLNALRFICVIVPDTGYCHILYGLHIIPAVFTYEPRIVRLQEIV